MSWVLLQHVTECAKAKGLTIGTAIDPAINPKLGMRFTSSSLYEGMQHRCWCEKIWLSDNDRAF